MKPIKMKPIKQNKALIVIELISDCVKEAGQQGIPSGHLYAALMTYWPSLSIDIYQKLIDILVKTNKITNKNHLLVAIN